MAMSPGRSAKGNTEGLALLRAIEARAEALDIELPRQEDALGYWGGVAFRLLGEQLLVPTADLVEILPPPKATRVPGAKFWVKGIANVRGTLVPVFDLREMLSDNEVPTGKRSGMLILEHQGFRTGVIVDEVLGMRRFPSDQYREQRPGSTAEALVAYIKAGVYTGADEFGVFDVVALLTSPRLMEVAA